MDLPTLLQQARDAGVTVEVVDDQLQIGAKASQSHWLEKLRPLRDELLELLTVPATQHDETAETERCVAKPFPVSLLPGPVGDYAQASAEAIGCDPSLVALPLLVSLARAIGNSRTISLKETWAEPAIVWAAIVGKSGTHKTPALQAGLRSINRKQADAILQFTTEMIAYRRDKVTYDRDLSQWKRQQLFELPPIEPIPPVCQRWTTSDCTIEALAALLAEQPDGLMVFRDELAGWLNGIAEYKGGRGSDLGHWLACWSAQPLTVDRKTGDTKMIHCERASVSLVGGIQPDVLRKAIGHEHRQDGLCARLLLAMPESRPVRWTDATVDWKVEAALAQVFERLFSLQPLMAEPSETDPQPAPEPETLALTREAKPLWVEYFNRHREESAELNDDLAAAWSKLEAYTARFALLFQLVRWAAADDDFLGAAVDEESLAAAIVLSDWFGNEARRVYQLFDEDRQQGEQRQLLEWIERRGGRATCRQVQQSLRPLRAAGKAEAALRQAVQRGELRREIVDTGGRPKIEFVRTTKVDQAA